MINGNSYDAKTFSVAELRRLLISTILSHLWTLIRHYTANTIKEAYV